MFIRPYWIFVRNLNFNYIMNVYFIYSWLHLNIYKTSLYIHDLWICIIMTLSNIHDIFGIMDLIEHYWIFMTSSRCSWPHLNILVTSRPTDNIIGYTCDPINYSPHLNIRVYPCDPSLTPWELPADWSKWTYYHLLNQLAKVYHKIISFPSFWFTIVKALYSNWLNK